nr:hypothetical protein [Tanacetum cinerariifolium]
SPDFQNTFEPSNASTNVVNAPRDPYVAKQDNRSFIDNIIFRAPDSPNQFHCFHCKDVLRYGETCKRCTCAKCGSGLGKGLCYICGNNQNSLNDSLSIFETSSQSPSNINHCCYECGDPLDGIFCKRCTCKFCRKDAHIGYNCPSKVPVISIPEPCNNQTIDELPQALSIFHPTFQSEAESPFTLDSTPSYVDESPNIFNPHPQPPVYPCEFCGNDAYFGHYCTPQASFIYPKPNDAYYGHYCTPQAPFIYPEPCYNQDFNFPQDFQNVPQQYPCCDDCRLNSNLAKITEQMTSITSLCDMACQVVQKKLEEKQIEEELAAKAKYWKLPVCYDDDDDEEISDSLDDNIFSRLPSFSAITPNEPASPPDYELVSSKLMEIVISEVGGIEASNDNPISFYDPIISGTPSNLTPSGESDFFLEEETYNFDNSLHEFKTFSKVLFDAEYESDSSDDQSCSAEDVLEKIISKPMSEEEIIPMELDQHLDNAEFDHMESLHTHESYLLISSKIDSLLDEFAGELTLLKSISPGINETDCDFKEDIRLIEKLLYDNSFPRLPKEFVSVNSDAEIKSFSPSPILEKSPDLLSHRCGTVKKFNTHRSHLNGCPMLIHGQNNPPLRMHPNRERIEAIDADEDITLVDVETQVDLGVELYGRKDNDNAAIKEASAAEPTVFDDAEVTMTMAQTLIKMKVEKARLLDDQMAKRLHDEEVEQAAASEKQEKDDLEKAKVLQKQKYQSLKRKPISIAQARKNMIVYLKNMAGYKIEHFKDDEDRLARCILDVVTMRK